MHKSLVGVLNSIDECHRTVVRIQNAGAAQWDGGWPHSKEGSRFGTNELSVRILRVLPLF